MSSHGFIGQLLLTEQLNQRLEILISSNMLLSIFTTYLRQNTALMVIECELLIQASGPRRLD